MPEPANNPTEPTPAPAEPTPVAANPAAVEGEPQPAAPEPSLLGGDPAPAEGEPKPAEGEPKPAEPKPEGAPEKYEFVAPEGKEYDPNLLGSFSEAAKELNLTQEAAQKMLDKMAPAIAARQVEQVQQVQKTWREAAVADKEYGGEKLQENLGVAKKGYDQFATSELKTLLEQTGLGNHPEVIRTFYRIGKAISEDTFVTGKRAAAPSPEAVFYPTMTKK